MKEAHLRAGGDTVTQVILVNSIGNMFYKRSMSLIRKAYNKLTTSTVVSKPTGSRPGKCDETLLAFSKRIVILQRTVVLIRRRGALWKIIELRELGIAISAFSIIIVKLSSVISF